MIFSTKHINKEDPDIGEFSAQIDAILETKFSGEVDTTLMKKQIFDVLDGDKNKALLLLKRDIDMFELLPEKLKQDADIIKVIISKNPEKFKSLDIKSRENTDMQELAVKSLISQSWDILDLIEILEFWKKKNKKLEAFTDKLISETPTFFPDEMTKFLYEVYKTEKKMFDIFLKKWFFQKTHSWMTIWSDISKYLSKIAKELEWNTPEESQKKLFSAVLKFLSLSEKSLWTSSQLLLETLIWSISITQKQEEESENNDEDVGNEDLRSTNDKDEELWCPSIWPYNYTPVWNTCRVWDSAWDSVAIDKKVFDSMSEKSLENFMNFSKLMKNLWLDFLIIKQHRLSQLVTGVNFYQWEGMSEAQTLKFLNSVGKNIWVPEESYEDTDWNRKVWCFDTIWAAKMKFREIKSTGNIGNLYIPPANKGSKTIVEIYMKHIGLLWEPFWELSVAKWK